MSMPKGYKAENGYATVADLGGMDYRSIALLMSEEGFKMNHATARNVFLKAMCKIASNLCRANGCKNISREEVKKIASNPLFQDAVCEVIFNSDLS